MTEKELSIEELLKIVNSGDESILEDEAPRKPTGYHRVALRFIKAKKIAPGPIRVPIYKIMYEFYKWDGAAYGEKCSATELGRHFTKYFDRERSGKYRYYMLNNCFDMSKEAMKKAKRYYRKWHLARKRNEKVRQKEKTSNIQPSTTE